MNDVLQTNWASPVPSAGQAAKPAHRKELPTGIDFSSILDSQFKTETPKPSQKPRPKPASDERDRDDDRPEKPSDQAAPGTPVAGTPTPPAQPVGQTKAAGGKDPTGEADGPAAGVTAVDGSTGAAGQVEAAQAANAQGTGAQGAQTPDAAALKAVQDLAVADALKGDAKDAVELSAAKDAQTTADPTAIAPAAAKDVNAPKRISLDDLQVQAAAQQATQAKTKEAGPDNAIKSSDETGAAQVQPAALAPSGLQGSPTAVDGLRLTNAATTTFEPARLTEAQNHDLLAQVSSSVESLVKNHQSTTLRVMLNPAELGRIDLRVTSSSSGMGVSLIAHQPATGQLLESQVTQLRAVLDQAGIHLTNLSVGQQNSSRSQAEQNSQRQQGQNFHRRAALSSDLAVNETSGYAGRVASEGYDYLA
jgi:flagellar hook-length control protein FliK